MIRSTQPNSWKRKMKTATLSNIVEQFEQGVLLEHAQLIDLVFEFHRREYHYSIKNKQPQLYVDIMKATKDIPAVTVQEAVSIYLEQEKLPHPNYFKSVALRLMKKLQDQPKPLWGKTI